MTIRGTKARNRKKFGFFSKNVISTYTKYEEHPSTPHRGRNMCNDLFADYKYCPPALVEYAKLVSFDNLKRLGLQEGAFADVDLMSLREDVADLQVKASEFEVYKGM